MNTIGKTANTPYADRDCASIGRGYGMPSHGPIEPYLPPEWQDDAAERRANLRQWGVILAAMVGVVMIAMTVMASRSPLYAAQNAPEAANDR